MKKIHLKKNLVLIIIFTFFISTINTRLVSANDIADSHSYLVKLKENVDSDIFLGQKKISKSKKKKFTSSNSLNLTLSDSEFSAIKNDSNILQIESDAQVAIESIGSVQKSHESVKKMKKDNETVPWGIKAIGGELTKEQKITGKSIKIGVLDTGISNHPDLEIAGGVSFVEDSTNYADNNGHGTHIAGTIAATDNKLGVVGIAPKVDLYSIKVLGADGTGSYSQVIQGIEWAISNKMDIINLSFGGSENSEILHSAIIEAEKAGLMVVAAAGNMGKGAETELYPALFPEVISVGATTSSNQRADYSSTGSNLGIMAPGSQILSTTMDGEYGVLSGTSMAAPHVTGAAALVWSKNKKLKNTDIKKILYDTATPLGASNEFGKGLLNAAKALGLTDQPIPPVETATPSLNNPLGSSINSHDDKLTILSEKLLNLKDKSISLGRKDLVKEINTLYFNLKKQNYDLHKAVESTNTLTKEQYKQNAATSLIRFQTHSSDFQKLEQEYIKGINSISKKMDNGLTPLSVTSVLSSNVYGNNALIHPGDAYTVGLTLETPISNVRVEVRENSTNTIVFKDSFVPIDSLHPRYTWNTNKSITAGSYSLKFIYPESPGWDDIFNVNIEASLAGQSVSSTAVTPTVITLNAPQNIDIPATPAYGYRLFKFTPTVTNDYRIYTDKYGGTGAENDTVLELYSDLEMTNMINMNDDNGTNLFSEITDQPLTKGVSYYIKLYGYGGGNAHARITVANTAAFLAVPAISTYADISVAAGLTKVYKYLPSTSGAFKISTSYYAGSAANGVNDTYFNIYSDPNLYYYVDSSYDPDGSLFDLTNINLIAGTYYYIEVMNIAGEALKTRLTVASGAAAAQVISLNTPIAVSTVSGLAKVFKFTPTQTRNYKFRTDYYSATSDFNDTVLEVYSDVGLTTMLPNGYNDDSPVNSPFSELYLNLNAGTSYYIKLKGYANGKVYAKMYVENGNPPVIGWNDAPTSGQTLGGVINGSGWALDWDGVNRVEVLIDNVLNTQAVYGGSREDVFNAYPIYNNHYSGYNFSVNSKLISNGSHNFVIREVSNTGIQTIIYSFTINIFNDITPPTKPTNLKVTDQTGSSVDLAWNGSTDDIGVTEYDIYNGSTLIGITSSLNFTVTNLLFKTAYTLNVKAKDAAGNSSVESDSVTPITSFE